MWNKFWHWLHDEEGWKALSGFVYLLICIFDFIVVPSWIGLTRVGIAESLEGVKFHTLDPSVQIQLIDRLTFQHQPFTLMGGGLFHLAFGALLTGSAISKFKGDK